MGRTNRTGPKGTRPCRVGSHTEGFTPCAAEPGPGLTGVQSLDLGCWGASRKCGAVVMKDPGGKVRGDGGSSVWSAGAGRRRDARRLRRMKRGSSNRLDAHDK